MKQVLWNDGWVIQKGEPSRIPGMKAETRAVTLPHDFTIETDTRPDSKNGAATGFYSGSTCTYTKVFPAENDWQGQQVLLHFDGVMGNTKVVVNGHFAGLHHYGYTPFDVDLTPYLYFDRENRVSVTVSTDSEPAARWYTGSGIYRDVSLLTGAPLHLAPFGLYVHTDHFVDADAFVTVEVTDAEGHPLPYGETVLTAKVEGVSTLQAFGSARPETEENYTTGTCTAYEGRALAVLRAPTAPGALQLTVSSPDFGEASLELLIEQ